MWFKTQVINFNKRAGQIVRSLQLIQVFWFSAFELAFIKEVIKRDSETIAEKFDCDDAWVMAVAIDNIFQSGWGNASLPGQGIDVIAMLRAKLLNTKCHQLSCIHLRSFLLLERFYPLHYTDNCLQISFIHSFCPF